MNLRASSGVQAINLLSNSRTNWNVLFPRYLSAKVNQLYFHWEALLPTSVLVVQAFMPYAPKEPFPCIKDASCTVCECSKLHCLPRRSHFNLSWAEQSSQLRFPLGFTVKSLAGNVVKSPLAAKPHGLNIHRAPLNRYDLNFDLNLGGFSWNVEQKLVLYM